MARITPPAPPRPRTSAGSDAKIARELGMDADEVLRLKQVTGIAELFADAEFSEAWEAE